MMIGLRPIRSESIPKTIKKGVPSARAMAIIQLVSTKLTFAMLLFCSQVEA